MLHSQNKPVQKSINRLVEHLYMQCCKLKAMPGFYLSFGILLLSMQGFSQQYTWLRGSTTTTVSGVYGTQGTAAPANEPGSRRGSATWTDAAGNLWLFGGESDVASNAWFSDLWKYDPISNLWAWIKGPNLSNQPGVYGIQGTASPANNPGARVYSMSWTDASGNFWLRRSDRRFAK